MSLLSIAILGLGFLYISKIIENEALKDKLRTQQKLHEREIYFLKIKIIALQEDRAVYRNAIIPNGVLDAVKIAMKVSHPDNGGKTADFIKYNELYKKLSK